MWRWYNPVSPTVRQCGGVIVSSSFHISVGGRCFAVTCQWGWKAEFGINQVYGAAEGQLVHSSELGRWYFIRLLSIGCMCSGSVVVTSGLCHTVPDNTCVFFFFAPGLCFLYPSLCVCCHTYWKKGVHEQIIVFICNLHM